MHNIRSRETSPRPSVPALAALACVFVAGSAAPAAASTVLYDSRGMAIDGSWSSVRYSMIGGFGYFGAMIDHQVADDFTITNPVELSRVTADFWTGSEDFASPAGGWLVEIFSDVGGAPAAAPIHAVNASGSRIGSFAWTGDGGFNPATNTPERRGTYEIDLTGLGVSLDAGTWWVSVVAVDETPFGTQYYWVGGREVLNGGVAHARFGGPAHGNDYFQPDGIGPNWTAMTTDNPNFNSRPYEMSMMIEGIIIPSPSAALLLLCGGLTAGVRRRR